MTETNVPSVPFGGAAHSPPLTADQRRLIRELIKEIAVVAEVLTKVAIGTWPPPESIAAKHLNADWNQASDLGDSPVRAAHAAILFSNAAGADHARAFVSTVNSKHYSFALAALTRAGVEAFAKSHFLLGAETAEDLVQRHVSLALLELEASKKYVQFQNHAGEVTNIDDHIVTLNDTLKRLRVTRLGKNVAGLTPLATSLLDASANTGRSRTFYSQLSGVVHGESAALNTFLVAEPGKVSFRVPSVLALEYAGMLCATTVTVLDRMVVVFGLDVERKSHWNGVKARADVALRQLQAGIA